MNKFNSILLHSIFFILLTVHVTAQKNTIVTPPENIKSIILRSTQTNNYSPIIQLGGSIILEFDDLNGDQNQYSYKIAHYNYDWKPSNLNSTEYINGYATDWIRDFENSFNTLQPYTHYSLQLPNDNTSIKISGNYVLSILNENNEIVFTRPFIIYEPKVNVGVSIHRSRDIVDLNTKQAIQFSINYPNLNINNPGQEIKTVIYQNDDWNTRMDNIKPQFYRGTQLLYKYANQLSYWAGNEYLFFDTKQIRTATNNIARVDLKDLFNTYLYVHEGRANKPYTYYPDIDGNFVIRSTDVDNTPTEADYTWVYFKLESFANIGNDDIYIYGNFNGWQLTENNKLTYNNDLKLYTGKLLLKQGFYNYTYVTADSDGNINNHAIEGSFYQTENNYTVLVYYKSFGSRYDQVIGYGNANSEKLRN